MTTTSSEGPADDDVPRPGHDSPHDSPHDTRTLPPPEDEGPRVGAAEARDLTRLRRTSGERRRVAGVAGGLARHLDVDPLLVRVGLVVLVFFGGSGLVLYLAGWLLVPADDTGRAVVHLDTRSRGVALVAAAVLAALALLGDVLGGTGTPWPAVVVGLLVLLVVAARRPAGADGADGPGGTGTGALPGDTAPLRAVRGPVLLWPTLFAVAVALGSLSVLDATVLDVPDGVYPALALALVGGALVLGAFRARPGGLIAVGLVLAVVTAATASVGEADTGALRVAPTTASALATTYTTSIGEMVVDLRDVEDLDALDGRTLDLRATAGRVEVLVPDGLAVDGTVRIGGLGEADVFGRTVTGSTVPLEHALSPRRPTLTLDVEVSLGEIVLRQDGRTLR